MITEHMTLTTIRDAHQWASDLGDLTDAQTERLGDWIWDNRPAAGCTYAEHPISGLDVEQMWEIAGDEDHDDYIAAVEAGAQVIEFGGTPDPVQEDLLQEVILEERIGQHVSLPPGRA